MLTLERIAYAFVHNQLALACLAGQGVSHTIPVNLTTFVHIAPSKSPGRGDFSCAQAQFF